MASAARGLLAPSFERRHRDGEPTASSDAVLTGLQFIHARLLAPPPPLAVGLPWTIGAVLTPTLFRLSLDGMVEDVTFVTYYPFVLLVGLFLDWRLGALTAVAAALLANFLFMEPRHTILAQSGDRIGAMLFLLSSGLILLTASTVRQLVHEVAQGAQREAALNRELQHRVRNTLTVVQGLAAQSFRSEPGAEAAVRTFRGRLHALAEANIILATGRGETCRFPDLAHRALAPFTSEDVISLDGPACELPERACVPLVLALHELGTNAVKYGALSTLSGSVDLAWSLRPDASGETTLRLRWTERGGPPVLPPKRRGLGSRLLAAQRGLEAVRLDYRPDGLVCELEIDGALAATA